MHDLGVAGQLDAGVQRQVVGGDDDLAHAVGEQVGDHVGHRVGALDGLAAGHRGVRVDQQLEGNVDVGGRAVADRQAAGVGVGAVAHVLEDVVGVGERRHADPLCTFGAHVGAHHDVAVHPHGHGVAADAGRHDAAVRRHGGAVVRAAGAEPGGAGRGGQLGAGVDLVEALEPVFGGLDAGLAAQALEQRADDDVGFELAVVGQELFFFLVELADDARRVGAAVEHLLGEHLEEGALFFDHEDLFEAFGELAHDGRFHREQHAHLEHADAVAAQRVGVEAHLEEGLHEVVVGLARRHDAEPGIRVLEDDVVEIVLAGVALGDFEAAGVERLLHLEGLDAHVHAEVHVRRELLAVEHEVGGDEVEARGVDAGGAGAVGHVGDDLHADPQAGQARHVVAVQAQVEDFLDVGRVERGHADVEQHGLGLAGEGGALAARVVADDGEHAAVLADAGVVGVLEGVAGAVDARGLAVPHAGDAVELLLADGVHHLGAPHGGGGEVFVEAVNELDVVFDEQLLLLDQRGVEHAHRGATVAGDEHAGLEAAARVGAHLVEGQPNQRVDAAEVDFSRLFVEHGGEVLL